MLRPRRPLTRAPNSPARSPLPGRTPIPSVRPPTHAVRPPSAAPGTAPVVARRPLRPRPRPVYRGDSTGGMGSVLRYVMVAIVLAIVGFGIKLSVKSSDDSKMLELVRRDIENLPDYPKHKDYYQKLLLMYHSQAFDAAYKIGGYRQSNSMDEKLYYRELVRLMAARARSDGQSEAADTLSRVLLVMNLPGT